MFHHILLGTLSTEEALDAPVVARTDSGANDDGGTVTMTFDPAPVDGSFLVAVATADGYSYQPPAGWTVLQANHMWYKIASSEGTTFAFTDVGFGNKGEDGGPVVMAEITGSNATSPIEDNDSDSGTVTTPAGTTLGQNRLALALAYRGNTSPLSTLTNSWTVDVTLSDQETAAIGSKEIPSTGSTGTSDWNNTASVRTLVIKP